MVFVTLTRFVSKKLRTSEFFLLIVVHFVAQSIDGINEKSHVLLLKHKNNIVSCLNEYGGFHNFEIIYQKCLWIFQFCFTFLVVLSLSSNE